MCKITWEKHHCDHKIMIETLDYCKDAITDSTEWKSMCTLHRSIVASDQTQSLCNKATCILSNKNDVWIYCTCRFDYKELNRNRYADCANASCNHKICENCKEFNDENVMEMKAEDEVEASSSSDHINWSVSSYSSDLGQNNGGERDE